MSFDLAVWAQDGTPTAETAQQRYTQLCAGDTSWTVRDSRIDTFWAALTARFPVQAPTDDETIDAFPWAVSEITPADGSVLLTLTRSRAAEVTDVVRALAHEHTLVCYDPQARTVHAPTGSGTGSDTNADADADANGTGHLELRLDDGTTWTDPDPATVAAAVRRLSKYYGYVIASRGEEWYLQAGWGPTTGAPEGRYALERRDGSADRHYQTLLTDLDPIVTAFLAFATNTPGWTDAHSWKRLYL